MNWFFFWGPKLEVMTMAGRQRLIRSLAVLVLLSGTVALAAENAVETRMLKDITYLASDELEGRGVSTQGINLAADYIAEQFKKAGLKPAGVDGSYFQPFTMVSGASKPNGPSFLKLRGPLGQEIDLKLGEDFQAVGMSTSGKVKAPLVFAGFGITAEKAGYDDYKGIDVAGKIAVVMRKIPRGGENEVPGFEGGLNGPLAALANKLMNAAEHKAAGVIFVNDRLTAKNSDALMPFDHTAQDRDPAELPSVHLRREVVSEMLESVTGRTLRDLELDIDRNLQPHSVALTGWEASLEVNVTRPVLAVKNVVGVLEGAGPLAKETVVIGAHYDHLGYGGPGSLARDRGKKEIHHGADDNASGTTTVMELARRFGAMQNRQGRRLVFMTFSGEESGLLGSLYYCKHPIFPLSDTVAMVNLDMVGRMGKDKDSGKDKLLVEASGTAKNFDALLDELNQKYGFAMAKEPNLLPDSDHYSFYAKGVPVIFYWTGYHADYHRPSDTSDKINVAGMARIADIAEETMLRLSEAKERPEFVKVTVKSRGGSGGGPSGPKLGLMPAYGDNKEGVLIQEVTEGKPAAKAGLKGGDRILELAGKPVKNLETYMTLMAGRKAGEPMEVVIERDGVRMTIKVTPE
jgi:hypothetical protein